MNAYQGRLTLQTPACSGKPKTSPFLISLRELLLDEEGPQMRQLPGASDGKHDKLDEHPSDNTGVGRLGLVAEFGFALLLGG